MAWVMTGGDIICGGGMHRTDCAADGGVFVESAPNGARRFDASGLILAPGIIDLHGDGFERNLSPRPGVFFPMETALIETDRQLVANGITTAYLAVTISWEPGLRSVESARSLIETVARMRGDLRCDLRIQLRWEIFALDAVDQIEAWLALEPKPTLAFNDHFTGMRKSERQMRKLPETSQRAGISPADYLALMERVGAREAEVPGAIARLSQAARTLGVQCLAHDEKTPEVRRENRAIGITLSEFPLTREAAAEAIAAGEHTILGAPNVVRGGSHIGAMGAEEAARGGLCTVLASDYYYPSQLRAVDRMATGEATGLAGHWGLISANAAAAAGLDDRGLIEPGKRADLIALRQTPAGPMVEAAFRAGQPVMISDLSRC